MSRILIAEDEPRIASFLEKGLRAHGYSTHVVDGGRLAAAMARDEDFDLLLLDLGLPDLDGFEALEQIRQRGDRLPVVILTARSDATVAGFERGADDYVTKPFRFDELLARIRVLVRRGPIARSQLLLGNLRVDESTRIVTRAGSQVELTSREFDVLLALARRPGLPMSRSALLAEVWQGDVEVSPNIVDVYIGYLRKKLEGPRGRRVIRTVRGKGFMLEA